MHVPLGISMAHDCVKCKITQHHRISFHLSISINHLLVAHYKALDGEYEENKATFITKTKRVKVALFSHFEHVYPLTSYHPNCLRLQFCRPNFLDFLMTLGPKEGIQRHHGGVLVGGKKKSD